MATLLGKRLTEGFETPAGAAAALSDDELKAMTVGDGIRLAECSPISFGVSGDVLMHVLEGRAAVFFGADWSRASLDTTARVTDLFFSGVPGGAHDQLVLGRRRHPAVLRLVDSGREAVRVGQGLLRPADGQGEDSALPCWTPWRSTRASRHRASGSRRVLVRGRLRVPGWASRSPYIWMGLTSG